MVSPGARIKFYGWNADSRYAHGHRSIRHAQTRHIGRIGNPRTGEPWLPRPINHGIGKAKDCAWYSGNVQNAERLRSLIRAKNVRPTDWTGLEPSRTPRLECRHETQISRMHSTKTPLGNTNSEATKIPKTADSQPLPPQFLQQEADGNLCIGQLSPESHVRLVLSPCSIASIDFDEAGRILQVKWRPSEHLYAPLVHELVTKESFVPFTVITKDRELITITSPESVLSGSNGMAIKDPQREITFVPMEAIQTAVLHYHLLAAPSVQNC